ncbi:helix-hairpin-helix domain-containing protein [Prolixibacteraceae bacterium JC049]|nr:helix-hairpin-helix domain-containing protein [Prolixibacteraceae bacterium JC049]
MFKKWMKTWLYYIRSDKIGTWILLCFFAVVLVIHSLMSNKSPVIVDNEKFEKDYHLFMEMIKEQELPDNFRFEINNVGRDTLKLLKLPAYVIKNWLNYKSKGGYFSDISDLKRIYGMNDSLLTIVKQYAFVETKTKREINKPKISKELPKFKAKSKVKIHQKKIRIEINSADSSELVLLKGIGPVYAKRIMKYRKILGGFYSVDQLQEVYGVTKEVIVKNEHQIWVDTTAIRKININFVSEWELKKHPYISKEEARNIVLYRSKNGKFGSVKTFNADSSLFLKRAAQFIHYVTL